MLVDSGCLELQCRDRAEHQRKQREADTQGFKGLLQFGVRLGAVVVHQLVFDRAAKSDHGVIFALRDAR